MHQAAKIWCKVKSVATSDCYFWFTAILIFNVHLHNFRHQGHVCLHYGLIPSICFHCWCVLFTPNRRRLKNICNWWYSNDYTI